MLGGEQRRLWVGRNFGTQRVHPPRPVEDGDWPRLLESGCSTPAQRERPLGGAESSWVSVKPGDMVLARAQQQRWRLGGDGRKQASLSLGQLRHMKKGYL